MTPPPKQASQLSEWEVQISALSKERDGLRSALESLREECERLRESGRHAQNTLNDMLGLKHDFEVLGLTLILEYIKRDDLQAANEKLRAEVAEKHEAYTIAFKQAMENGEARDAAIAERDELLAERPAIYNCPACGETSIYLTSVDISKQLDAALAKAKEFEAALEFYANEENYNGEGAACNDRPCKENGFWSTDLDSGERARAALKQFGGDADE